MPSDLRRVLNALYSSELADIGRWAGLSVSGRSNDELRDEIWRALDGKIGPLFRSGGPLTIEDWNDVAEDLEGQRRKALSDVRAEILGRLVNGDELDRAARVEAAAKRGHVGLHSLLREHSQRELTLRKWVKDLRADDRAFFFRLARHRQGSGRPIENVAGEGFIPIAGMTELSVADALRAATHHDRHSREHRFQKAIELVHRLKSRFRVYVGRTFLRTGRESLGLRNRWESHRHEHGVSHGAVLSIVPRTHVETEELLAIRLVKLWEHFGVLCCNNDVMLRTPSISEDAKHVLYLCVSRR